MARFMVQKEPAWSKDNPMEDMEATGEEEAAVCRRKMVVPWFGTVGLGIEKAGLSR